MTRSTPRAATMIPLTLLLLAGGGIAYALVDANLEGLEEHCTRSPPANATPFETHPREGALRHENGTSTRTVEYALPQPSAHVVVLACRAEEVRIVESTDDALSLAFVVEARGDEPDARAERVALGLRAASGATTLYLAPGYAMREWGDDPRLPRLVVEVRAPPGTDVVVERLG